MKVSHQEKLAFQFIDTWLNHQARYSHFPGFQICIRKKGQVVLSKAYGSANLKTKRKLTTRDLFHIASHSKSFTSCALLQLVQEGKLGLHQPAVEYLPDLKKHKDKRFKEITIRDFLSNRSGIFRDGVECDFWELQRPFLSKEQLLKEVLQSDLIFEPNEYSKYSNIGFSLLGLILEQVQGKPYEKVMDSLVLQKLQGTHILPDYSEKSKLSFADGHSRPLIDGKCLPIKHAPALAMAAATGFCATAEDTSFFFEKLLLGQGLLKKDTQKELLSLNWPVKNTPGERYGLGLQFSQFKDIELIGHSGGYPGFTTKTVNWVGTDYTISIFHNANNIIHTDIILSIIKLIKMINEKFPEPEAKKAGVTVPFMNKWGSVAFVLGPKIGLGFSLDTWKPLEETFVLKSKNAEDYLIDNASGYYSFGEKITFNKDKQGNILSTKWGGATFPQEKVFLENLERTLL